MNRWKVAFFVALVGWVGTVGAVGALGYAVIDQGVTDTYGREGHADCEAHRDVLHALAKGRLTKSMLQSAAPQAADVQFQYDAQGRYAASQYGASTTPGYTD